MEHTDAPLTPPRDPRVAPPPMTNAEIRQWIDACNHEPARQVLRSIVGLREEKFDIVPMGEIRHLKGQINTLAAKIESDAKVIAALREALEFYADPFAWKKLHDPGNDIQVPDFYSETSFGDTAIAALKMRNEQNVGK